MLVRHRDVHDREHHEDDRPAGRRSGCGRSPSPSPSTTPKNAPTTPEAAHSQSSRKMISPAYMFPKSRSECDSGLETYSTRLNSEIERPEQGVRAERRAEELVDAAAHALHLDREEDHQRQHRERQRESRVHVGGRHQAPSVLATTCVPSAMTSTGRKSIAFISSTQTNTVSASGRRTARLPWKDAFHLVVDEVEQQLDRTPATCPERPAVALAADPPEAARARAKPSTKRHRRACRRERPEPPSPSELVRWRQVVRDVVGRPKIRLVVAMADYSIFIERARDAATITHRDHERPEERERARILVNARTPARAADTISAILTASARTMTRMARPRFAVRSGRQPTHRQRWQRRSTLHPARPTHSRAVPQQIPPPTQ